MEGGVFFWCLRVVKDHLWSLVEERGQVALEQSKEVFNYLIGT